MSRVAAELLGWSLAAWSVTALTFFLWALATALDPRACPACGPHGLSDTVLAALWVGGIAAMASPVYIVPAAVLAAGSWRILRRLGIAGPRAVPARILAGAAAGAVVMAVGWDEPSWPFYALVAAVAGGCAGFLTASAAGIGRRRWWLTTAGAAVLLAACLQFVAS